MVKCIILYENSKEEKEMNRKLRVGIISDVHIGFNGHNDPKYFGHFGTIGYYGERQKLWWKYTLTWFKNRGVDLILCPGDMSNACDYETWSREKAVKISKKEILGYTFIAAHWGKEKYAESLIEENCKKAGQKPVFYIQHNCLNGTTIYSSDKTDEPKNVKKFENLVILTGHTHSSIVDENTIWQPDEINAPNYTTVNCSSLNYGYCSEIPVNGENLRTKQALYMTVVENELNFERLSFWTKEMIELTENRKKEQDFKLCTKSCGNDWNFKIGEKKFDIKSRKLKSIPPEFSETAYMGVMKKDTYATLFFPAAKKSSNIHSYVLEVYDLNDNKVAENIVLTEHHIDNSCEYFSKYYSISVGGLAPETEYIFKVYARDWFLNKSNSPLIVKAKSNKCKTKTV